MCSRLYYIMPNEYWSIFLEKYDVQMMIQSDHHWIIQVTDDVSFDQFVFELSDFELLSRDPTPYEIMLILKEKQD